MATPGHFLENTVGVMDLRSTIWSTPAILMVVTFPIAVIVIARILMPRPGLPLSHFPDAHALAAAEDAPAPIEDAAPTAGFAAWIERSPLVIAVLVAALLSVALPPLRDQGPQPGPERDEHDAAGRGARAAPQLGGLHTAIRGAVHCLLAGARALPPLWRGRGAAAVHERRRAPRRGVRRMVHAADVHVHTAAASSIVAIFIPSSGGQWVVQGFVTSRGPPQVGTTAQHGLLAMSVGDHVGNLVSPFWPVLIAGIARVDFRTFFGYGIVFGLLWFVLGVAIFVRLEESLPVSGPVGAVLGAERGAPEKPSNEANGRNEGERRAELDAVRIFFDPSVGFRCFVFRSGRRNSPTVGPPNVPSRSAGR